MLADFICYMVTFRVFEGVELIDSVRKCEFFDDFLDLFQLVCHRRLNIESSAVFESEV